MPLTPSSLDDHLHPQVSKLLAVMGCACEELTITQNQLVVGCALLLRAILRVESCPPELVTAVRVFLCQDGELTMLDVAMWDRMMDACSTAAPKVPLRLVYESPTSA